MRNTLRTILFLLASFLVVRSASAGAYNSSVGASIDTYLTAQGSPMAGLGSVFFNNGVLYNVDPRLIVAIAGFESGYGVAAPCYDAWGWLPVACVGPFISFTVGIESVTSGMHSLYLMQGFNSIPLIGASYCSGQCPAAWIAGVTSIYQALGGDPTDLTFTAPGSLIDFEQFSSSPSYFSSYGAPISPYIVQAGTITATFNGGVPLSAATNLPGDQSTTYGTAAPFDSSGNPYCAGCSPTIEIDFSAPVMNFSVFIINGNLVTITYTLVDDAGGSSQITLAPNFSSGVGTVALPPTDRITQVLITGGTLTGSTLAWDFFIDNVSFAPAP